MYVNSFSSQLSSSPLPHSDSRFISSLHILTLPLTNPLSHSISLSDLCQGVTISNLSNMIEQYSLVLEASLYHFSNFIREEGKFHHLLLRVSTNLIKEGFCTKEEDQGTQQEGDIMFENNEEAGMGEGKF